MHPPNRRIVTGRIPHPVLARPSVFRGLAQQRVTGPLQLNPPANGSVIRVTDIPSDAMLK
ncbi:hypothetical protein BCO71033_07052 [Burkholderia contaminans]|uniref:Uncharacterized protein n=1 Tax=Burkholderia contaminans TaxID=488447 RepID=A0A6P3BZG2_9BURK|nr:hypothetical protein BCO71033_07052 [Burkholderia contaminans]